MKNFPDHLEIGFAIQLIGTKKFFFQYGSRSAFLNEEDLCDIQKELGESYLCDTCKMYPRHVEEYEGLREYSLSLSCPKAAEMILENKNKVKINNTSRNNNKKLQYFACQQVKNAHLHRYRRIGPADTCII